MHIVRPAKPPDGKCPQDADREVCNLVCKYNHFESDDLTIESWELKCLDCGLRQTIAYRSDEEPDEDNFEPTRCPFCQLRDLQPGQNPCQSAAAN